MGLWFTLVLIHCSLGSRDVSLKEYTLQPESFALLGCHLTLRKSLNLSEPQFIHL